MRGCVTLGEGVGFWYLGYVVLLEELGMGLDLEIQTLEFCFRVDWLEDECGTSALRSQQLMNVIINRINKLPCKGVKSVGCRCRERKFIVTAEKAQRLSCDFRFQISSV